MSKNNIGAIDYGYKQLANAIIGRAMLDYYESKNTVKGRRIRRSIEDFVRSSWYMELTDIDPDLMLEKLHDKNAKRIVIGLVA